MIFLKQGRLIFDEWNYLKINVSLVIPSGFLPLFKLEKTTNFFEIEKQCSYPAIPGKSFSEGGAFTNYILSDFKKEETEFSIQIEFCEKGVINKEQFFIKAGGDSIWMVSLKEFNGLIDENTHIISGNFITPKSLKTNKLLFRRVDNE